MSIGGRSLPQNVVFVLERTLLRFAYNRLLKACLYCKADSEPAWCGSETAQLFRTNLLSGCSRSVNECFPLKGPSGEVGCGGTFCGIRGTVEPLLCTDYLCVYRFSVLKAKQVIPHLSFHVTVEGDKVCFKCM